MRFRGFRSDGFGGALILMAEIKVNAAQCPYIT